MFKRTRYQFGNLDVKRRKRGPDVWVYRYRTANAGGGRKQASVVVGTVHQRVKLSPETASGCLRWETPCSSFRLRARKGRRAIPGHRAAETIPTAFSLKLGAFAGSTN